MDLSNAGKYAEARASVVLLLKTMEGALGPEAEELLPPLDVLSYVTRRSGQLADSYTIMLRTLNISEKHHGEEGMYTCHLRSKIGAFELLSIISILPLSASPYSSPRPPHTVPVILCW